VEDDRDEANAKGESDDHAEDDRRGDIDLQAPITATLTSAIPTPAIHLNCIHCRHTRSGPCRAVAMCISGSARRPRAVATHFRGASAQTRRKPSIGMRWLSEIVGHYALPNGPHRRRTNPVCRPRRSRMPTVTTKEDTPPLHLGNSACVRRFQVATATKWIAPRIVEIAIGLEINAYACADPN
jgi:coenzyme PQQ precursor peptide PqqA